MQEWLINNLKVSVKCQHFFEYWKKMMFGSHRVDEFTGWIQTLNRLCVSIFKVEVYVINKQDQESICNGKCKHSFALANGIIFRFIQVDLTSNFLQSLVCKCADLKCVIGEITRKMEELIEGYLISKVKTLFFP